jgi:hypothetical protein
VWTYSCVTGACRASAAAQALSDGTIAQAIRNTLEAAHVAERLLDKDKYLA